MNQTTHDRDHRLSVTQQSRLWAAWLRKQGSALFGSKLYLLTLTYDRYRNRYHLGSTTRSKIPCRAEVLAGMTGVMPKADTYLAYQADLHRWYLRLLRELFGRGYKKEHKRQPRAIGYFDEPVHKGWNADAAAARLSPGDYHPHIHLVMVVDGLPCLSGRQETTTTAFERLYETGELQKLWRRWNPSGEVHVKLAHDVDGALDYVAKTAKKDALIVDHQVHLPFGGSTFPHRA